MQTFKTNRTYSGRFICDADSTVEMVILKRTTKQVTVRAHGEIVKRKIHIYDDSEFFFPFGQHSMALTIRASKEV